MRWDQGRADIERMLADRRLQRVPASREHAERMLAQARKHLTSAQEVCGDDPEGGYALLYDASRKALAAVLGNQGLRPTSAGGHLAGSGRGHRDDGGGHRRRRRHRLAVRAEALDMQGDRLADQPLDLLDAVAGDPTPGSSGAYAPYPVSPCSMMTA